MTGRALLIRKRRDGSVVVDGGLPDRHVFSARWIARELGHLCRVTVTLTTSEGEQLYELEGFEPLDNGEPNLTALVCRRAPGRKER